MDGSNKGTEDALRLGTCLVLRQGSADAGAEPLDLAAGAFAKAERNLQSAPAEFSRIQTMQLGDEGRLKLRIAMETGRNQLDRFMSALI